MAIKQDVSEDYLKVIKGASLEKHISPEGRVCFYGVSRKGEFRKA